MGLLPDCLPSLSVLKKLEGRGPGALRKWFEGLKTSFRGRSLLTLCQGLFPVFPFALGRDFPGWGGLCLTLLKCLQSQSYVLILAHACF
ncbi:hypothetical protein DUNSADRAFT_4085 [Dunaliella salina]|uniref:Encoded protein n=1 Tax=Dunaliella salina TaxID=3046 RepID=A0ABQ7GSQ3_DUNSA|nr:hypothetical protein DUNSADRAFT_4085 [Dunaliella salina]|eukprot:KAF5837652.1 hypothetical protein DUNSADRAFT_4085 [Dunaliella salina]